MTGNFWHFVPVWKLRRGKNKIFFYPKMIFKGQIKTKKRFRFMLNAQNFFHFTINMTKFQNCRKNTFILWKMWKKMSIIFYR